MNIQAIDQSHCQDAETAGTQIGSCDAHHVTAFAAPRSAPHKSQSLKLFGVAGTFLLVCGLECGGLFQPSVPRMTLIP